MTTSYHVEEARRRSRVQEACLYPNGTVHNTSTTVVHTMKERRMNRNVGKIVVCAFVFTLTCASGGWAQQPQPSGGTPVSQATPPAAGVPAREQAPRRLQRHGMRGHTSMRLQHDLARRLTHITEMQDIRKLLTPEQQQQFRTMQSHLRGHGGMSSPEARG